MHSLKPLTQEQRQSAYEQARKAIIRSVGEHPKREHFTQHAVMKYPPVIRHLINLLCIVLLLAAFTPSAIRLFVISSETFGVAVPDELWYPVQELRTIRNLPTERLPSPEIASKP